MDHALVSYELETGYVEPNGNEYPDDTCDAHIYQDYFVAQQAFNDYNLATLRQAFEASDYDIDGCNIYKKLIHRDMSSGTEDIVDYIQD